jgi:hypothetical protein
MSKPDDASLKDLIATYPADWAALVGTPPAAVEVIDADVSTVTAAADKILRLGDPEPWLLHIELQSSPRTNLAEQLHWYNTLLRHRHGQRVRTVLVLLRPSADSPQWDGIYQDRFSGEPPYVEFRYRVVRPWQMLAETFLTGGLGTLPLALLSDVPEPGLPDVLRRMDQRLAREVSREQAAVIWTTSYVLTGLRLAPQALADLFQGVAFMSIVEDSSAFELLLAEGARRELRKTLLRQGRKRFGAPEAGVETALQAITDLPRLERMSERLLDVTTWAELLATP